VSLGVSGFQAKCHVWNSKPNKWPYQGNKRSLIGLKRNRLMLGTTAVGEHGLEQRKTYSAQSCFSS